MGFSPGEFKNEAGELMHIEGKDKGRVIFWTADEMDKYFSLDRENALILLSHLETLFPDV